MKNIYYFAILASPFLVYFVLYILVRQINSYDGGIDSKDKISINGNFDKVIRYTGFCPSSISPTAFKPLIILDKKYFNRPSLVIDNNGRVIYEL